MGLLRNKEVKRQLLVHGVLTILCTTVGFLIGLSTGILALVICLVFCGIHFVVTKKRYVRIAALSEEIDGILHNQAAMQLSQYAEGELSILQNEISKLLIRLREQADILSKDKQYLADSMADISHQLRTPLTSLHLVVSMLSDSQLSQEKRRSLLQELNRLLTRMDWLIEALLKISKLDTGTARFQEETISVKMLIEKAATPIAIPMELREQTLELSVQGTESYVGDLAWSMEAVGNILKNCMEHMPAGGKIFVAAEENAIYTQIQIRDTGAGFAKEDLPRLFERFYKGKNSGEQSIGIGLALARMIVTAQNGTIQAENHGEGGALFTIRFYKSTV